MAPVLKFLTWSIPVAGLNVPSLVILSRPLLISLVPKPFTIKFLYATILPVSVSGLPSINCTSDIANDIVPLVLNAPNPMYAAAAVAVNVREYNSPLTGSGYFVMFWTRLLAKLVPEEVIIWKRLPLVATCLKCMVYVFPETIPVSVPATFHLK